MNSSAKFQLHPPYGCVVSCHCIQNSYAIGLKNNSSFPRLISAICEIW